MIVAREDVRFEVETEKCTGCKHCIRICQEDVWHWDAGKNCAVPKYPDECVKCYQCETECLGDCFEIVPLEVFKSDPLENTMQD